LTSLVKEEELILGKREPTILTEPKKVSQMSLSMSDPKVPTDENRLRLLALQSAKTSPKEEQEMVILLAHIQEMLSQKPVWLKTSIESELLSKGIKYSSDFTLKKALSALTYLFKNGPWKFTYVKFGYDPRKQRQSYIYQTFNVGVGNSNFLGDTKTGNR
jgi:RNA polymerase III transcription factor (TF)IIIC subunit HTH domain